ncbi:MAG: YbaN family protein [Ruminiclostridium sp.]
MKKIVLLISGWALIVIAAIGVFLPILPTTPLVILAAMCFSYSSERMHRFLLKSHFFGSYIENFKTKQGISVATKASGIIVLWVLLTISAVSMNKTWSTIMFAVIGIGVTTHLLLLKTKKSVK